MDKGARSIERRLAKPRIVPNRGEETGKSAEATRTRQGFLHDHWFASDGLIIRQLPDRWFKFSPRNHFLGSNRSNVTEFDLRARTLATSLIT